MTPLGRGDRRGIKWGNAGRTLLVMAMVWAWMMGAAIAASTGPAPALDPRLEARIHGLFREIRCIVCQSQSLEDSHAPLAQDLRALVLEGVRSGKSDGEIKASLVARYGDFILFSPPFKTTTILLWTGPFLCLIFGVLALMRWALRAQYGKKHRH